jgi:hypothetical protein
LKKPVHQQGLGQFDVFKELATGMSKGKKSGAVYEEQPVDVETFINDKKFLNQRWNGKNGCRPKILAIIKNITDDKVREAMALLGKGSGKDYLACVIHLYGIYKALCLLDPQSYYGLVPGSPIYFVNTARNEGQARKVFFTQFLGLLRNCPWFKGKYEDPSLGEVKFIKDIYALSGNSQAFGWLGFNTIQWVGDELAFFLENDNNEESESKAEECWEAAYGSCQTRFPQAYKMIGITTPRYEDDFVMKKCWELEGRNDGYFVQMATWEVNPNISKDDFKYAFMRNYRRTMRDFGAKPMGVIESFWSDPEFVELNVCPECRECVVYQNRKINTDECACRMHDECRANPYKGNGIWAEWFKPVPDARYSLHFDLSKNKDRLGFGLSHSIEMVKIELDNFEVKAIEENKKSSDKSEDADRFVEKALVKLDAVGWIDPRNKDDILMLKNGEIHYHSVLTKIILYLKDRGFDIAKISFDQYQSLYIKQQLEDLGYEVELLSCDRTDEIPVSTKNAFTENRVEYPYCKILCKEAKNLKYIQGKKVDHAEKGIVGKGSKDIWDSVACSIFNSEKVAVDSSCFLDITPEED